MTLPIIFEALHVYVPASGETILYTVNEFSMVVVFNDLDTIIYLLLLPDTFIITSLKYQMLSGTGSPVALQINVSFSVWFLISSLIRFSICGMTTEKEI